jgi:hypothetical protein
MSKRQAVVAAPVGPQLVEDEAPKQKRTTGINRKPRTEIRLGADVRERVEKICKQLGVSQNFLYVHAIAKSVLELERLMADGEVSADGKKMIPRREMFEQLLTQVSDMYSEYSDRTGFTVDLQIKDL